MPDFAGPFYPPPERDDQLDADLAQADPPPPVAPPPAAADAIAAAERVADGADADDAADADDVDDADGIAAPGRAAAADPAAEEGAPFAPVAVVELNGRNDGQVTVIAQREALIGRDAPGLTLALPFDGWVSAIHARLSYHDDAWWLEDRQSRNGTWIGAQAERLTTPQRLTPGMVFRLGHTDLTLSADPEIVRSATEQI